MEGNKLLSRLFSGNLPALFLLCQYKCFFYTFQQVAIRHLLKSIDLMNARLVILNQFFRKFKVFRIFFPCFCIHLFNLELFIVFLL